MPSFLRLAESQRQLIARVIVILPSSVSRAAWSSDSTAMVSPRCSRWSRAASGAPDDGAHEWVNDRQTYSTNISARVARRAEPLLRIGRSGSPRQRTCGQGEEWERHEDVPEVTRKLFQENPPSSWQTSSWQKTP